MAEKYFRRTQTQTVEVTTSRISTNFRSQCSTKRIASSNRTLVLQKMAQVLEKKMLNKKRYHFQILKQFFLFPDASLNSSLTNGSFYYAVLTGEEKLHSLFKILETQMLQTKIWAILNLKFRKMTSCIAQAVPICTTVLERRQLTYKFEAFREIKNMAERIPPKLNQYNLINISIFSETPKKSLKNEYSNNKSEYNISRQTEIDSYMSQKSLQFRGQQNDNFCNFCCQCSGIYCCDCRCSCSCQKGYNLQDRMQYLRMLEQMVRQSETE